MPSSLLGYVFVILNILPSLVLTSGIAFAQQPEYDLSAGPNGISVFRSTSAVLTGVPGSPFVTTAQALNLASDMTGQFVYATLSNGSVAGFTMDASTGELTPVSGMPISTGTIANQLRVHPSGRFVYVSNLSVTNPTGSVSGFLVNQTTGALTPLPGSPYASSVSGFDLALDPTGAYLYVAGNLGGVAIMAVDQNTGVLIPVSGSPFPLGTNLASIVVHPNGRYVYAADFRFDCCGTAGSLWAFQYDPTSGRVTTVPGSPYFVVSPHWVATDPSGAYLYAASTHGNGVYGYTINQSTGALTSISGSPFPAGQGAVSIAVDSTGQFAYQGASAVSQDITSYSINGLTGGLSRIGLPFAPAPGNSILVVRPVHAVVPVIVPSQGGNNGLVSFQLFGSGFESGATVVLSGGGVNISATNVRVTNTSLLTGTFNLFGVAPGLLDVTITNPDNSINTLPNAFTVQQGGTTQISASLIGRDKIRFGTPQTYYIQVSNTGTIDSEPGLVTLSVPSSITGSQSSGTSLFAAGTTETLFPETFTSSPAIAPQSAESNSNLVFATGGVPAGSTQFAPVQLFDVDTSDFTVTTAWQHDQYPTSFDGFLQQQGLSYWSIFINPLIPKQCQSLAADVSSAYSAAAPLYSEYEEAFAKSIVDIADLPVSVGKSVFEINELEATGIVTVGSFTLDIAKGELSACKDYLLDGTQQACLHSAAPHLANLQSELNKYLASKGDIKLSQLLGTVGELIGLINDLDELNTDIAGVPKAQAAFESQFPKYVTAYNKFATCIGVTPSKPAPPYISYPLAGAGSVDPNDKRGIKGAGPEGYVSALTPFSYSVFFENESSATAPARSVSIVDQLDNTLKPESVVLGSIALAGQVLTPTSIRLVDAPFNGTIDLRPTTNMIVKITASIDPSARLLKWSFQSLDPITNEPPTDPLAGFLPPGAEGSVFFTVLPQSTVRTGTAVSNTAAVIFDANPPINTPTWLNTIDNTPPISKVSALSDVETTTSFPVHWSASDSGAGVQDFMIYVAIDGGPFTAWQANTTATDAAYTGTSGHSYSFYSIARDLVGNIEDAKTSAEAVTTIIADSTPPVIVPQIVGTLGSNGWYRSNVSVSWLVNDPESGVAFSNGCAPVTLTAETAGMTLTCSATNGSGLSTSIPITLKIDETPPLISGMPTVGCSIWPPNGKFVQVGDVRANDRLSGFALGSLKVTGLSSELADDTHNGPVLITPDGAGGFIVQVQADRSGTGNGRIYMVNATVMDNAGNTATASATCTVPHDQGKH